MDDGRTRDTRHDVERDLSVIEFEGMDVVDQRVDFQPEGISVRAFGSAASRERENDVRVLHLRPSFFRQEGRIVDQVIGDDGSCCNHFLRRARRLGALTIL